MYLIRVTQISESLLQPLEDEIRHSLLPTLTGQAPVNDQVRRLCALPARHGGLGIVNPTTLPAKQHLTSRKITQPLVTQILQQSGDPLQAKVMQKMLKRECKQQQRTEEQAAAYALTAELPQSLRRGV